MLLDFENGANGLEYAADVCVIGGGAAGITIALDFADTCHSVLLLESGGRTYEAAAQRLYDSDVIGLPHRSIHGGRARVLGGATTLWAGQALPLDDLDFQEREWVPNSGWPIGGELEPYYRRAEQVLGIRHVSYDERTWPNDSPRPLLGDDNRLQFRYSQFSPTPDFSKAYRAPLMAAKNVRVVLHANVTNLETDASASRVECVRIRSASGKCGTARARYYVICCGGIDTPRLLLASDGAEPAGLGNRNDLVGRYFQEHVHLKVPIRPANRRAFQRLFNSRTINGIRCFPKIAATCQLQRERQILNVGADLCYGLDEDSAVESAKRLWRALRRRERPSNVVRAIWKVGSGPHELCSAVYGRVVRKQKFSEGRGPLFLSIQSEMLPNPESRVYLGGARDGAGVRRVVLDWRLTEMERHTISCFAEVLKSGLARLGLAEVDDTKARELDWKVPQKSPIDDAAHHMGTTRMHDDPKRGVVDRHCRVHGVENLYVGSSSVFPTGGYSNPTLTLIALCHRIGDSVKGRLA
jgi:choline dehydrogenase-like flavoprotein